MEVYARYCNLNGKKQVNPIEIPIYEPVPDKPGFVRETGMKHIGEVLEELMARLEADGILPDEYFRVTHGIEGNSPFPEYQWISCFAVTGSSEGHYIHIEAILLDGSRKTLFLGKTFKGMDFAYDVARACAKHLGA